MCKEVPLAVRTLHDTSLIGFVGFAAGEQELGLLLEIARETGIALGHHVTAQMMLVLAEDEVIVVAVADEFVGLAVIAFIDELCTLQVDTLAIVGHAEHVGLAVVAEAGSEEVATARIVPDSGAIVPPRIGHKAGERLPRT